VARCISPNTRRSRAPIADRPHDRAAGHSPSTWVYATPDAPDTFRSHPTWGQMATRADDVAAMGTRTASPLNSQDRRERRIDSAKQPGPMASANSQRPSATPPKLASLPMSAWPRSKHPVG
jgi:hypothetical protein